MPPLSDDPSPERRHFPKPTHSPPPSLYPLLAIVSLIFVQILVLLLSHHRHPSASAAVAADTCKSGKFFVYDLPPSFNAEIHRNCDELSPWGSLCDKLSNSGYGRPSPSLAAAVPRSLAAAWFSTDQFAAEIIFHHRLLHHPCRTTNPASSAAFYIPFYAGLAVGKHLWSSDQAARDRDRQCDLMLRWIQSQPYFRKSNGWDHFITMGRITWDFRRTNQHDWGSRCIYAPGMTNITRLLIERNPWDALDVGIPYPTAFHPSTDAEITTWQNFLRSRARTTLFSFVGATRGFIKNDFRGLLLNQCRSEPGSCRVLDCSNRGSSSCANGSAEILTTFLDSEFCLQPRGDSFTRRSTFDCMLAGSIPVFFWKRTAYMQYQWFLPDEPRSYSVFIHRDAVKNGTSIRSVLEGYSKKEIGRMRERIIENLPRLVYGKPGESSRRFKDAVDVAVEGVLNRVKDYKNGNFRGNFG